MKLLLGIFLCLSVALVFAQGQPTDDGNVKGCLNCVGDISTALADCSGDNVDVLKCITDILGAGSDCLECICIVLNLIGHFEQQCMDI